MTDRDRQLAAMGRPERRASTRAARYALAGKRVLVTGAAGQIGRELVAELRDAGITVVPTDVDPAGGPWGCERMDITRFDEVMAAVNFHAPDLIVNLAAAKLAPAGELNPWLTLNISVNGLKNLLDMGRRVVHVSTCKAGDPEVAYGAGKLAAEKLALSYGATVVRLYNVPEAGPSMLTTWRDELESGARPRVSNGCVRYTVTLREAVAAVYAACGAEPGLRYSAQPGDPVGMRAYFRAAFPGADYVMAPPRRGDRLVEPRHAACEHLEESGVPGLDRIVSVHDKKE